MKQRTERLKKGDIENLSLKLTKEGYDQYITPVDKDGNQTITWPAHIGMGKQLEENNDLP